MVLKKNNISENKFKLSIQVSLDGFSFCGLDVTEKKIVFFKDIIFRKKLPPEEVLEKIEAFYSKEVFLKNTFEAVNVLFSNELYSIVPGNYFNEENASDYLKYNTRILETDFVAHDKIEPADIVNIYIPYTNINNFFFDHHGEFEYRHCVSVLIEELLKLPQKDEETYVYLNNHSWGYDLIVIKEARLILANSFPCETKEDFIYYLLFTAEQLELNPEDFKLVLMGHIARNSEYYKMAYTYVKNIDFLKISLGLDFDAGKLPPKAYQYFTLFKTLQ